MVAAIADGASPTQQTGRYRFSMQQQPEDNLIYWAPSRVRFNLTLILAVVVVVLGVLPLLGIDLIGAASASCNPQIRETAPTTPTEGGQTPAPGTEGGAVNENESGRQGNGQAWMLILVGLGVGAYSWLTSPRQYRIYPSSLVIYYGMPRRRTVPFSAIREVANDHGRGAMGDPLRVYTANRRRIPIQVREPDEMYPHLQRALEQFRRDNPQYAPPEPEPEAEPASAPEADTPAPDTAAPDTATGDAERRREGRPRRRSLRDDDDAGGNGNGNDGSGNDGNNNRPRRRRSLRDDNDDGS